MKPKTKSKQPKTEDVSIPDVTLAGMVKRRASNADGDWERRYKLSNIRKENKKLYDSSYVDDQIIDDRYEQIFADNRLFVAVRTLVPFITSRITQPEIIPNEDTAEASAFASKFEKILVLQAEKVKGREKVKLACQDLLTGQRIGVLKWRYNPSSDCLELEHIDPDCIIIDNTCRLYEEPKFVQVTQKRSVSELLRQFPDKSNELKDKLGIQKGVPSQLELEKKVTENWMFVDDEDTNKLIVVWMFEDMVLGKMGDPNWMNARKNLIEEPMVPFVFFNFINDGSGYIDNTSFIEQAKYNQQNYDKMGSIIVRDADYAGIGVPVFGQGAIDQGEAAKVQFSPIQRIMLDVPDVSKSFTTWQSGPMPQFITDEKIDSRNNVDNTFGTPNIFRGEQSKNNTLGQDIIVRDQAEGRQSELVDAIDSAMARFYQIEAQLIYRYYDEKKYFSYIGEDGKFEKLVIDQADIADNVGIQINITAGTSLPIDKAQKRATVLKIADRLPTLTLYKTLGIENPEETYKLYLEEQTDPRSAIAEADKQMYDAEANEDLQLVMAGKPPEERDDITAEYIAYLNEYLMTEKFSLLKPEQQAAVSQFVDEVVLRAQTKVSKMATQEPVPDPMQPPIDPSMQQDPNAPPDPNLAPNGIPPVPGV